MAKRFTDSRKWDDPWFAELNNSAKLAWIYLLDKCDHYGIYKPNLPLLNFQLKVKYTKKDLLDTFKKRIVPISSGKWFIPKYIKFQYGDIASSDGRLIKSVYSYLKENKLIRHLNTLSTECQQSVNTPKDMDKDKDMDNIYIYIKRFPYLKDPSFKGIFESYLSTRKKKATPHAKELILRDLHKHDMQTAVAMLEQSIKNGWIGVFELKNKAIQGRKYV